MDELFTEASKVTLARSDVILGRGHGVSIWPGNVAFRHIVWAHRERYNFGYRKAKRDVGRCVVKEVQEFHGRFLMINPSTGYYHEVSRQRAEDKTCQALRQKGTKMPPGFNLQAMKNKKKWFRTINETTSSDSPSDTVDSKIQDTTDTSMNHPLVQSIANKDTQTSLTRVTSKVTHKDCNAPTSKSLSHTTYNVSPCTVVESLYDDIADCNDIDTLNDNDLWFEYPTAQIESSLSMRLKNGFIDENAIIAEIEMSVEHDDDTIFQPFIM